MNYDEFAFFNQQLAAMLRDGIPMEGALEQLCRNMGAGKLRTELELLEADLRRGEPVKSALAARQLPDFYVSMVSAGVAGNDLPAMLILLADYYRQTNSLWTRLKGLMVYPLIVLVVAFLLSLFLAWITDYIVHVGFFDLMSTKPHRWISVQVLVAPVFIGSILLLALTMIGIPFFRRKLRWRFPPLKDARLSQLAATLGLMLKNGCTLDESLTLVEAMETGSPALKDLHRWHADLAQGRGNLPDSTVAGSVFPPLFLWLISNAGEDLAGGFLKAAEIYHARATQRMETLLYAALPVSVLALGVMIIGQIIPIANGFSMLLNGISS